MKYLVDTHVFLWVVFSPQKISKKASGILLDSEFTKFVSAVTFWEISLKFSLKKMDLVEILPDKLPAIAKDTGFEILGLEADTASSFYKLPKFKNRDPFDRMLAWQAISENCHLVTKDKGFEDYRKYGLKVVW